MNKKSVKKNLFDKNNLNDLKSSTPFFIFNKKILLDEIKKYQDNFPDKTEICYAMKANSEKEVLEIMNKSGTSFEVASSHELDLLKKIHVSASRILFGTSIKTNGQIKDFVKYGVDRFAFDSEQELLKIAECAPGARVYVRVLVNDRSDSVFHMSDKFGTSLENALFLLVRAKELGLVPYAISFNVGSQARNEYAWARGIKDISLLMKRLLKKGIKIEAVNLGGGFPHSYQANDEIPKIKTISQHIKVAVKGLPYPVKFIIEPGRGLVASSFCLIVSVIGKVKRSNGNWLYVDAGVYNALLEALNSQGSTKYKIESLAKFSSSVPKEYFIVTGPTGDNLDVLGSHISLSSNIAVGDKLVIYDTGAYTFTLATKFNGFPTPKTISI